MGKIWHVVRREYLERVRKKGFWIATLLLPVFMVAITLVPLLLTQWSPESQKKIAIVDLTGQLYSQIEGAIEKDESLRLKDGRREYLIEQAEADEGTLDTVLASLKGRIVDNDLYGVVVMGSDLDASGNFTFYGRNVSNITVIQTLYQKVYGSVILLRIEAEQIEATEEQITRIMSHFDFVTIQVGAHGEERKSDFLTNWFGTIIFVLVLYMSFLMYGASIIRGVLEEKTARIIEVLLSTFSPFQLLMGKILGLAMVGLTQIAIYAVAFSVVMGFGAAAAAMFDPKVMVLMSMITPAFAIYFAIFFILGYFLFATLFATVGSLCNSEQEAQNMQWPLIVVLVIPMISAIFLIQNPDSLLTRIISLIPVFTPMVMFMRISVLMPPFWEIALSITLLVGTIVGITWIASKIFRVAILMYGKRPGVREIFRWIRAA